jgi:hypothetical protein
MILEHFPKSDPALVLAPDPESADIILIGGLRDENDYVLLRNNALVRRFPEKCFVLHSGDFPPRYVKGILTNLASSPLNLGRFESGGFFLMHPDFKNPYAEEFFLSGSPPETKRDLFFSFVGRDCTPIRRELFRLKFSRPDVMVVDNSHFNNFAHENRGKTGERFAYFSAMQRSKFALCPRGWGPGTSQRLFDAMQLGTAPVSISDSWVFPSGPDWKSFCVQIPESRISNVEEILSEYEDDWEEMGRRARRAYEDYFYGEAYIRYLVGCCRRIGRSSIVPESLIQRFWPVITLTRRGKRRIERLVSRAKAKR